MPFGIFKRKAAAVEDNKAAEVQVETPDVLEEQDLETFTTADGIEVVVNENYNEDGSDEIVVGVTEGEAYDIGFDLTETHDLDCPDCEDGDDPDNNEDPESIEGSVG